MQSRFDRDKYVKVLTSNIPKKHLVDFEIHNFNTYQTPWNFESIMLYGSFDFAIDPSQPTMVDSRKNKPFKNNVDFVSRGDIEFLRALYKCPKRNEAKEEKKIPRVL
eukprot:Awhi_evm1s1599